LAQRREVRVIVICKKSGALLALAFLLLPYSMMVASASRTETPFWLEAHVWPVGEMRLHLADGAVGIWKYAVEGFVETSEPVEVGTINMDIIVIGRARKAATVSGQFVIDFYSGETVEGTITGTEMVYPSSGIVELDCKFVGHGDIHVMGEVHALPDPGVIYFEGYSW
jgi:hypothetical protein